eukprot:jgi/Chlat1/2441/Chrsp17S08740
MPSMLDMVSMAAAGDGGPAGGTMVFEIDGVAAVLLTDRIRGKLAKAKPNTLSWEELKKNYIKLNEQKSKAMNKPRDGGSSFWHFFTPVVICEPEDRTPSGVVGLGLLCICQDVHLNTSNPAKLSTDHLASNSCKGLTPEQKAMLGSNKRKAAPAMPAIYLAGGSADKAAWDAHVKRSRPEALAAAAMAFDRDSKKKLITHRKDTIEKATHQLCLWVYKNAGSIPLSVIEHPDLKAALKTLGHPGITRQSLANSRLDKMCEAVRADVNQQLQNLNCMQVALEGLKKSSVQNGQKLIHYLLNLPDGGSLLYATRPTRIETLHGAGLMEQCHDVMTAAVGQHKEHIAGVVADGESLHKLILRSLETLYPWVVATTCQAYALDLLMRDLARALPFVQMVLDQAQALAVFFSTDIRAQTLFLEAQKRTYGGDLPPRALMVPPDTRPGRLADLLKDVYNAAEPLRQLASSTSWEATGLDAEETALATKEVILSDQFWADASAGLTLLGPIRELLSWVETERPLISQIHPMWVAVMEHVKQWCAGHGYSDATATTAVRQRWKKSEHGSYYLSFLMDPHNHEQAGDKFVPPLGALAEMQQEQARDELYRVCQLQRGTAAGTELQLQWMAFMTTGLDPDNVGAVQVAKKQLPIGDGVVPGPVHQLGHAAKPEIRRMAWSLDSRYPALRKAAVRLMSLCSTSCAPRRANLESLRNNPIWKWAQPDEPTTTPAAARRAEKLMFVKSHFAVKDPQPDLDYEQLDMELMCMPVE